MFGIQGFGSNKENQLIGGFAERIVEKYNQTAVGIRRGLNGRIVQRRDANVGMSERKAKSVVEPNVKERIADLLSEERVREWEEFNESYMNPSPESPIYLGRDPVIGKQEAQRRLKYLPLINEKSTELLARLEVSEVTVTPKGSVAVERCTPSSDLDIAVEVKPDHIFTKESELWMKYYQGLVNIEADGLDFRIEPRLCLITEK